MAGGEPPNSGTLEFVHLQSRRAEAFAKRGDFKRAISSHQAATATLRHLIRSVTEGQLADLRRTAARADEFAMLDSLYAQLEQHTLRQSALLEQQLLVLSSKSAAKNTGTQTTAQPSTSAVAAGSPVGGGGANVGGGGGGGGGGGAGGGVRTSTTPVKSPTREGPNAEHEERDILIGDLRCQLDALARENEALTKENKLLKAQGHLPIGCFVEQPTPVAGTDPVAHGASSGLDCSDHDVIAGLEDSGDYLDVSVQTGGVLRDLPPLQPPAFDPQGFESD